MLFLTHFQNRNHDGIPPVTGMSFETESMERLKIVGGFSPPSITSGDRDVLSKENP